MQARQRNCENPFAQWQCYVEYHNKIEDVLNMFSVEHP